MARTSRTRRYIERKAIDRLPGSALDLIGLAVVEAVDRAVEDRWDRALRRAADAEGDTVEARIRSVNARFRRELTAMGAASGAVAATPGIGTGTAASALLADLAWLSLRATDLVMTIGAVSGHTDATVEERRAWVLSILAFGEEAAAQFAGLMASVGAGAATDPTGGAEAVATAGAVLEAEQLGGRLAGLVGGDAAAIDTLRRVNANLAKRVVARYGPRRTVVAFGRLLPFGIGAAVGGGTTWILIRVIGRHAELFFADRRHLGAYADAIPTTGRPVDG
jgi:hypothetical protein